MGDLIGRKALLRSLKEKVYPEKFGERCNALDVIYAVMQVIDEQSTAFDLESVIAELKKSKQDIAVIYTTDKGIDYEYADGIKIDTVIAILNSAANATNGKIGG